MIPEIREFLEARPFTPFYIHTSGGNRYRLATPDHAGFNPSDKQIAIWFNHQGSIIPSSLHIVGAEKEAEPAEQAV